MERYPTFKLEDEFFVRREKCCGHHLRPEVWAQSQGQGVHNRLDAGQGLSRAWLNKRRSLLEFSLFSWE
jgi:hypothetical protein